jgi:hypothetical protein
MELAEVRADVSAAYGGGEGNEKCRISLSMLYTSMPTRALGKLRRE